MTDKPLTLTRAQVRRVDARAIEELAIPGLILMENAGLNLFHAVTRKLGEPRPELGLICGRGNNGGDGAVLARHWWLAGYACRVYLLARFDSLNFEGDGALNLRIAKRLGIPFEDCPEPEDLTRALAQGEPAILVDAYLGTGLEGPLHAKGQAFVEAMNACEQPILAVDCPSGLDCDTGEPQPVAVKARWTVTMAAIKRGFLTDSGEAHTGELELVGIGVPESLIRECAAN